VTVGHCARTGHVVQHAVGPMPRSVHRQVRANLASHLRRGTPPGAQAIELDPHVTGQCLLTLDEDAARVLHETLAGVAYTTPGARLMLDSSPSQWPAR
jgi:hypothetical protein